jgi:hypothetical protein
MSNHTGLSPQSPNKYLGPDVYLSTVVTRNREPTGADYRQPETGKLYPFGTFWLVGKNPTTGIYGQMFYLSKIVANVAYWLELNVNTAQEGSRNIGFTYDSGTGTFTVCGEDGEALSPTNPGFITLQDKNSPGLLVTIAVTANQDFIDATGASEIIGNTFGLTSSIAASVDVPFFLYAVANDTQDSIAFMISRYPNSATSPDVTRIAKPGVASATTQNGFFALEDIVRLDYDSNPCLGLGSFRMQMNASNDWTVQALNITDGINHFQEGKSFTFPPGQFGAATGGYFNNNGGTAPDADTKSYVYFVTQSNRVFYNVTLAAVTVPGVGAVTAQIALPFNRLESGGDGTGHTNDSGAISVLSSRIFSSANDLELFATGDLGNVILQNQDFTAGISVTMSGNYTIEFA